ncbi:MAG: 50S ribosomal protein L10 [Corallococcus sp.]|nr:50S ribosomal protein L10 [Corallococcus sp.]MCM1360095.1 50S ribosomal protein L10 [Corallococcus sp.]MCM1395652.1 50S ribosomal protein L10 [Corallococcus sp.]
MEHERHEGHLSANQIQKRELVEQIKETIQNSKSFVILDYKGLTVAQDTEFRAEFRKNAVDYKVLKNTLVKKALNELGYTEFDEALNGPSAFAFGTEDAIAPAKVAAEGCKNYKTMQIKCGMFDQKFADASVVDAMSKVPNKETLLAMLVSVLSAPMRGLAVALNAVAEKQ